MSVNLEHVRVTSTNDSDEVILTCPEFTVYEVCTVHVIYTSTATVGNRQVNLVVKDDTGTLVASFHAGATQAASLARDYTWGQGTYRETSFIDGSLCCPFPINTYLLPGWTLTVVDSAAVDAAADDFVANTVCTKMNHTRVEGG